MRKIIIGAAYFIGSLVTFALLYFAADAILSRISASSPNTPTSSDKYNVYVLSNGVHTDLVFPVKTDIIDWLTIFPPGNNLSKDSTYQYIAIGWGDKGFYLNTPEWKDLSVKTALVAALGLGETALHVTYYKHMQEDSLCYKVAIDSVQFVALKNYVLKSYVKNSVDKPILIETTAQYGNSDSFYEANGAYSMFHSCNTWANTGLKTAGMPAAMWTVFDTGILRHYRHKD